MGEGGGRGIRSDWEGGCSGRRESVVSGGRVQCEKRECGVRKKSAGGGESVWCKEEGCSARSESVV